jgi:O-antigen/teichoic acid export membrane protein
MGRFGADNAVLRFVSVHSVKEEWNDVHAVVSGILKWVCIITIAVSIVVCLLARQISTFLFHKEELTWPLFWTSLSIPFFAVYNILGMALQGRKKVLLSVTTLKIAAPLLLILAVLIFPPKNGTGASLYYSITSALTVFLGYYWWKKNTPPGKGTYDFKQLWKSCYPLWVGAIMQQLVVWGGQFVAGIYNTPVELAQLAVARNTSVLITFILTAVNYVSAPRFAAMYSQGKMEQLKRYARNATWLMTLIATPIVIFIWFFPEFIMSLFGKDFHSGIWLLRVLAVGQYINVITGSVGYLLIMSGHEADMMNIRIINGVGAVVLAFILNPLFGAIGSAIATSIALAGANLMALGLVKKRLGFNTMSVLGLFK